MLWETSALFIDNCNSVMKHIYMHAWYQTTNKVFWISKRGSSLRMNSLHKSSIHNHFNTSPLGVSKEYPFEDYIYKIIRSSESQNRDITCWRSDKWSLQGWLIGRFVPIARHIRHSVWTFLKLLLFRHIEIWLKFYQSKGFAMNFIQLVEGEHPENYSE